MTADLPEIRVGAPIVADYGYITARLRPDEIAQHLALTGLAEYQPDVAARGLIAAGGESYVMVDRMNRPVLIGGFVPVRPGVYEGWLAGTEESWARHWRAMTKVCAGLMENLLRRDAHRIETCALASRTRAHAWYERALKMHRDGVLPGYFADGQDGILFSLTRARA